jgi:hypothetical protein
VDGYPRPLFYAYPEGLPSSGTSHGLNMHLKLL